MDPTVKGTRLPKFQSIDSLSDTEFAVDFHANSNCYQWAM
jgi:hypothetical protein